MFHVFPTRVRSGLNLKTVFQFSKPILGATVLYVCLPKSFISPFQVRKARAYIFTSIFGLSSSLFLDLYLMCCDWTVKYLDCCLGVNLWLLQGETEARLVTFAQARLTHPGETCRNRPGLHSNSRSSGELLFWARHYLAQATDARLSENAWKPWCATVVLAQARNLTFGRGVVSLRREELA